MLAFNLFLAICSNFNVKLKTEGAASPPPRPTADPSDQGGLAPPSPFSFTLKFEHMAKNILKANIFCTYSAIYFQRDLFLANILERSTFNEIYF